jgi:hypothetical protein
LKAEILLTLDFPSEKLSQSTYSALVPDNVGIPECMKLDSKILKKSIRVRIISDCPEDTLISTAEDILKSCELSLRTVASLGDS